MCCLTRRDLNRSRWRAGDVSFYDDPAMEDRSGINSTKYRMQTLDSPSLNDLLDRLTSAPGNPRAVGQDERASNGVPPDGFFRLAMGDKTASGESRFSVEHWFDGLRLRLPLPWPRVFPTRPEMDRLGGGTRPTEFARDTALNAAIQRFAKRPRTFAFARHPIFGELTECDGCAGATCTPVITSASSVYSDSGLRADLAARRTCTIGKSFRNPFLIVTICLAVFARQSRSSK